MANLKNLGWKPKSGDMAKLKRIFDPWQSTATGAGEISEPKPVEPTVVPPEAAPPEAAPPEAVPPEAAPPEAAPPEAAPEEPGREPLFKERPPKPPEISKEEEKKLESKRKKLKKKYGGEIKALQNTISKLPPATDSESLEHQLEIFGRELDEMPLRDLQKYSEKNANAAIRNMRKQLAKLQRTTKATPEPEPIPEPTPEPEPIPEPTPEPEPIPEPTPEPTPEPESVPMTAPEAETETAPKPKRKGKSKKKKMEVPALVTEKPQELVDGISKMADAQLARGDVSGTEAQMLKGLSRQLHDAIKKREIPDWVKDRSPLEQLKAMHTALEEEEKEAVGRKPKKAKAKKGKAKPKPEATPEPAPEAEKKIPLSPEQRSVVKKIDRMEDSPLKDEFEAIVRDLATQAKGMTPEEIDDAFDMLQDALERTEDETFVRQRESVTLLDLLPIKHHKKYYLWLLRH
jgi:hypothetical protein